MKDLTSERLHELFKYDPETGEFTSLKKKKERDNEYTNIYIDGKLYRAHRLAHLYMEGEFPKEDIHHINEIKFDNRWKNLEPLSKYKHSQTMGLSKNNTSGVTGVSYKKSQEKWRAQIELKGVRTVLGLYTSFSDAVRARYQEERRINWKNKYTTAYHYLVEHNLVLDIEEIY